MDEKIYTPEVIQDNPFPSQLSGTDSTVSQTTGNETYSSEKIKDSGIPTQPAAIELLSTVLNTKSKKILGEFELADSGGIRSGKYQNGVSGEMVMTPAGLTARNKSGNTTLAIDAETGDAVFTGEIRAGSFIADESVRVDDGRILINDTQTGKDSVLIGVF